MRTHLFRAISILMLLLSAMSCGTSYQYLTDYTNQGYEIGDGRRINGKVFQTITNHMALVNVPTQNYNRITVLIANPNDSKGYFFDDLSVNGNYIFIGTDTYKTNSGMYRTVPVFVEEQYYTKGMVWNDWLDRLDYKTTD